MVLSNVIDRRQILANHFLFQHLADQDLATLLTHARVEKHRANDVIFRQGMPGHNLIAVLSGQVKITIQASSGKEIVLAICNPGEVFGELALLDGKPRSADAIAISSCELLVIDRRDFLAFLEARPAVCIRLLAVLSARLRRTDEQVQELAFLDLPSRLAKTLVRLCEAHSRASPKGLEINLKLSQHELGRMVGGSRESVNKQLRAWQNAGLVRLAAGKIIIQDLAGLRGEGERDLD